MTQAEFCHLTIKVTPKTSSHKVVLRENTIRVYVTESAQDQAANEATCRLLAKSLKIASSKVWIISGHNCRDKKIHIEGLDKLEAEKRLQLKWGHQLSL